MKNIALWVTALAVISTSVAAQHGSEVPENESVKFYCHTQQGVIDYVTALHSDGEVDPEEYTCYFLPFEGWGQYEMLVNIPDTDFSVYVVYFENNEHLLTFR